MHILLGLSLMAMGAIATIFGIIASAVVNKNDDIIPVIAILVMFLGCFCLVQGCHILVYGI